MNYDKFDMGLMFDSSNYEEEDDEDYSMKEDLKQNQQMYKDDEES